MHPHNVHVVVEFLLLYCSVFLLVLIFYFLLFQTLPCFDLVAGCKPALTPQPLITILETVRQSGLF